MAAICVMPYAFRDLAPPPAAEPLSSEAAPDDRSAALARAFAEGFDAGRAASLAEAQLASPVPIDRLVEMLAIASADFKSGHDADRRDIREAAITLLRRFSDRLHANREADLAMDLVDRLLIATPDKSETTLFLSAPGFHRFGADIARRLAERGVSNFIRIALDESLQAGEARLAWRGGEAAVSLDDARDLIDRIFTAEEPPPADRETMP